MGRLVDEGGARSALRDATRQVHERLHVAAPFLALARGTLGLRGYAELLAAKGGYYAALPPSLAIEPARLRLIEQDLADLGQAAAPTPALRRALAAPLSADAALGWRYVVEGSVFGGRVIYRQLDYLFGNEAPGRRFFRGTPGAAARWAGLCGELERAGSVTGAIERMIEGAHQAFAAFEAAVCPRVAADA